MIRNLDVGTLDSEARIGRQNNALRESAGGDQGRIKKLAEEFESIFLELMLKSMRDSLPKSGLVDGGNGEQIFRSLLDGEYARAMAGQRQSGLADSIEKFLLATHQQPVADDSGKVEGLSAYRKATSGRVTE